MKKAIIKNRKLAREIYDQNYYNAQEMLLNPWFQKKILWLKNKFRDFGCPIPKEGFKTLKEYMDWNQNQFWKSYFDTEKSSKFQAKLNKITGGKKSWGTKEQDQIEKLKLKLLPPIYGETYDEILEKFNINRKDRGFRDFLERHIFFNKDTYFTPLFSINWIRNKKTNKMELFVKLNGHTRKEDLTNGWDFIANEQKSLPDYMGKNKKWITFERDNGIYEIYLKLKKQKNFKRSKDTGESIDTLIYIEIRKKHYSLTLSTIRSIIHRVKNFRVASKEAA